MNYPCIVIGGDHHNTLGILRALGRVGIRSHLIIAPCNGTSYVAKSKYVEDVTIFSSVDKIVPYLTQKKLATKAVVICCSDAIASEIDKAYDVLKGNYICPNSSNGSGYLTKIMDKEIMTQIAVDCGLPIPNTWASKKEVKFPCFIKPLVSKDGSKSDITICHTANELDSYMSKTHVSDRFQFQEFIDKDFEFQLIGLSLDAGKKVIIPGISRIIRSSETSNTGYLSYQKRESIDFRYWNECESFLRHIGFSGLFSIEFLRDKHGNDFFMEINLRNDGNSICTTIGGVNLPFIWYDYSTCGSLPTNVELEVKRNVKVLPEFDDLFLLKQGKISLWQWLKALLTADGYMEFSRKDIVPVVYRFWQLLFHR
jgi:predicted ATP-grasp superfamily ATP-dependent carboligase